MTAKNGSFAVHFFEPKDDRSVLICTYCGEGKNFREHYHEFIQTRTQRLCVCGYGKNSTQHLPENLPLPIDFQAVLISDEELDEGREEASLQERRSDDADVVMRAHKFLKERCRDDARLEDVLRELGNYGLMVELGRDKR